MQESAMPDPKDNAKQTGDSHPPEVEDRRPGAADDDEIESRPGQGENQAGFLKDTDTPSRGSKSS
jgi:hypothetical protein